MSAMSATDHLERLERERAALFAPLREHYAEIEKEIEETETRLAEMRKTRTEIRSLLRLSGDPEFAWKKNGPGPKPKRNRGNETGISEQKITALADWLQARAPELNANDGFYAMGLLRDYPPEESGLPFTNQSPLAKALRVLHNRGVIRLDGIRGSGGAKHYKVVAQT